MKTFKDKIGQDWEFSLDLGTLHEITNGGIDFSGVAPDINLLSPDKGTLELIMFNPMVSIPIVWFCVKDNLGDKRDTNGKLLSEDIRTKNADGILIGKTPDIRFYNLFSQEIIEEVSTLLLHEVTGFFPAIATTIPKLIQTFSRLKMTAQEVMEDEEILTDQELKELIRESLNQTKTNLRDRINSGM